MKGNKRSLTIVLLLLILTICSALLVYKINNRGNNISQNLPKEEIEQIPTTEEKIKNIIYMIGDGMGENHIIAGGIYKGVELNIQKIPNKSYVKTASTSEITDSAAAATALATGYKTNNDVVGKNQYGENVENLIEFANIRGMKTGIVCTKPLNDSTPASFSVHNDSDGNLDEIAQSQIESCIDLMFGGGRKYFSKYQNEMEENNFRWVNNFSELRNISKSSRIIGTFAEGLISEEENRISLADLTKEAIARLDNDKGFFLMVEGSAIDTYSHDRKLFKALTEMIDFDDAVSVAKEYVDTHQDTLLIVTADHETGGLNLDGVTSADQLTDSLYTAEDGYHTNANVLVYAYGKGAQDLTQYDLIDNTSICKFVKQGIRNNFKN